MRRDERAAVNQPPHATTAAPGNHDFTVVLPVVTDHYRSSTAVAERPPPTAGRTGDGWQWPVRGQPSPAAHDPWLPPAPDLPTPPSDGEKYQYLADKKRWVPFAQLIAVAAVSISIFRFFTGVPYAELFMVPLLLNVVWGVMSFVTTSQNRRDTQPSHELRAALYRPVPYPSVDIFLPTCGEDRAVLENTYHHVSKLDWPGRLRVHALDDAGSDEVRQLARQHGFEYHRRPDRGRLKKAGNLRYGYEHSDGDFITIFDADFCPRPDFLRELMPYFEEQDVGIVQSPQYFDVTDRQNWLQRAAGAGQEYFYRWVQPSRDRANGAICVGTNAIYRRAALRRSGGFAQIGHSEDVHTGVNMLKVGYRTRYVPVVLAKGLCPDNLNQFVTQQYRWCTGSMSLLFSTGFHRAPMPVLQRMCFWSGFLYYISTAVNVLAAPLPPIIMGLVEPQWVKPTNYIFVAVAVLIWYFIYPVITSGRGRRIGASRLHVVYSFAHATALWHVIRKRSVEWVPTGVRRGTKLSTKIRLVMSVYLLGTQCALWFAIAVRGPQFGWDRFWPMALFAASTLLVVVPLVTGWIRAPRKHVRRERVRRGAPALHQVRPGRPA
jgi:cellulose synthase/poly-beta-1,6-N-acetylglucosamine synthase-like glycosyltransferase